MNQYAYALCKDVKNQTNTICKWDYGAFGKPVLVDNIKLNYPECYLREKDVHFDLVYPRFAMAAMEDGTFYVLFENRYIRDYQDYLSADKENIATEDLWTYVQQNYFLYHYDSDGNYIDSISFAGKLDKDEISSCVNIIEGKNNELVILSLPGKNIELAETEYPDQIIVIDASGNPIDRIEVSKCNRLTRDANGNIVYCSDGHIKVLAEEQSLQNQYTKFDADDVYSSATEGKYQLLYRKDNTIYGVTPNLKSEQLIQDINRYQTSEPFGETGDFVHYQNDSLLYSASGRGYYMKRIVPNQDNNIGEREVLTFALLLENSSIRQTVIDFNQANEDYYIDILDFTKESSPERALSETIGKGTQIDLYDLAGYDYSFLKRKGLLADITPLMESDSELSSEDFVEGVYQALLDDGAFYEIVASYSLLSMLTIPEYFGGVENWSYNTLEAQTYEHPEVGYSSEIMNYAYLANREKWVDSRNGTCSFNSESFITCLQQGIDRLPVMSPETISNTPIQTLQARGYVLYMMTIRDIPSVSHYNINNNLKIVPLGIPGDIDCNSLIYPLISIGITSNKENMSKAWTFARILLTDSFQRSFNTTPGYFALRTDTMNALYKSVTTTDYYCDEIAGPIVPYQSSSAFGSELTEPVGPADLDCIELFNTLLTQCKRAPLDDYQILDMMSEELSPAFNQQKTVTEAVEILQKRVSVYLAERDKY